MLYNIPHPTGDLEPDLKFAGAQLKTITLRAAMSTIQPKAVRPQEERTSLKEPRAWCKLLLVSLCVLPVVMREQKTATATPFMQASRCDVPIRDDQPQVDARTQEVSAAMVTLQNYQQRAEGVPTSEAEKHAISKAILLLGRRRFVPSARLLAENLDFVGETRFLIVLDLIGPYPAYFALQSIGDAAMPEIIGAVAAAPRSIVFRRNAFISVYFRARHGQAAIQIISQYADEYASQARRLRRLTEEVPDAPDLPPEPQPPYTLPTNAEGQATRLARIFALEAVLTDPNLTEGEAERGNAKVVLAMNELVQLHALEALPLIVGKLDTRKSPPQEDDKFIAPVMVADPQGLLSANIAEATPSMVRRFGSDALPALVNAVAMNRRTPGFQTAALRLLTELAGGPLNAKTLLLKTAEEDEAKAQRLRAWMEELRSRD